MNIRLLQCTGKDTAHLTADDNPDYGAPYPDYCPSNGRRAKAPLPPRSNTPAPDQRLPGISPLKAAAI